MHANNEIEDQFLNMNEVEGGEARNKAGYIERKLDDFLDFLDEKFPIFHPSSMFKDIWDLYFIIVLFSLIYVIPIKISFRNDWSLIFDNGSPLAFLYIIYFSLVFDILINLNTGVF